MNPPIIQRDEGGPLYRRADIAWLPSELVERARRAIEEIDTDETDILDECLSVLEDILEEVSDDRRR